MEKSTLGSLNRDVHEYWCWKSHSPLSEESPRLPPHPPTKKRRLLENSTGCFLSGMFTCCSLTGMFIRTGADPGGLEGDFAR
jgi:hypothetical protein